MAIVTWEWEEPLDGHVAVGGDLVAVFLNYEPKSPGHLQHNSPEARATLLAREAIQNSWDSAIELAGDDDPQMSMRFEYDRLEGDRKADLVSSLSLQDLRDRLRLLPANGWKDLRLPGPGALNSIESGVPLEVLRIQEVGTTGMYGPWVFNDEERSKMIFAMMSVGFRKKSGPMAGGAFGMGKAGLIAATATRTVVAYSCFRERENDLGVTRRLIGVTYWGGHNIQGRTYTGFGKFWAGNNLPFENEKADEIAEALGMGIRSPSNPEGQGTSFLVISPTVEPNQLLEAVERNWWPAIGKFDGFEIEIVDYEGQSLTPRPKADPELRPYIRAYEIAEKAERAELGVDERFARPGDAALKQNGGRQTTVGRLGLVADREGWSFQSMKDATAHRSLVALVRGPRMVTEYWVAGNGGARPYVRGVFIAENGVVDDLLRQTEPPLHDSWNEALGEGGVEDEAPKLAKKIHDFVLVRVNSFRGDLKPPAPPRDKHHLPDFDKILKDFFKGGRKRASLPPPTPRDVHVEPANRQQVVVDPVDKMRVRAEAGCTFSLTELGRQKVAADGKDAAAVRILISFRFDEDGRAGSAEDSRSTVQLSSGVKGFKATHKRCSLVLAGTLGINEEVVAQVHTEAYDPDFAGRITFSADLIAALSGSGTESDESDG